MGLVCPQLSPYFHVTRKSISHRIHARRWAFSFAKHVSVLTIMPRVQCLPKDMPHGIARTYFSCGHLVKAIATCEQSDMLYRTAAAACELSDVLKLQKRCSLQRLELLDGQRGCYENVRSMRDPFDPVIVVAAGNFIFAHFMLLQHPALRPVQSNSAINPHVPDFEVAQRSTATQELNMYMSRRSPPMVYTWHKSAEPVTPHGSTEVARSAVLIVGMTCGLDRPLRCTRV